MSNTLKIVTESRELVTTIERGCKIYD